MAENVCDTRCPLKALWYEQYQQGMNRAGLVGRAALTAKAAANGLEQMALAASCPQKNVDAEAWQPSEHCSQEVQQRIGSIDSAKLSEWGRSCLAPFLQQNEQG